jgi:hypothetical protein
MELKAFIAETLQQICAGVKEAQLADGGDAINAQGAAVHTHVPGAHCGKRALIAAAIFLILCVSTQAQTLTECGKSDGYAYYFVGGVVPADKGGWQRDGITGGRIILNYINGEIDLLIKSAPGTTASVKQDGGKIIPRQTSNGLIALTVFYENEGKIVTTEDYAFQVDNRGDGTVAWTGIRTASNKINKMSLMTAQCRGPR